jgi:histidine triad (HIT) family protein
MALTPEQVKELKAQLFQQVQSMPEPQKSQAIEQINVMSAEALESMIKQQQSRQGKGGTGDEDEEQKGVFRMIIDKEIPSKVVAENEDCLAVLDIKPISKGHTVIITKKQAKEEKSIPSSAFKLAKTITKNFKKKLKAKDSLVAPELKFGEYILNVIPIYDKPLSLSSPRTDAPKEELEKTLELIKVIEKIKKKIQKIKIKKQKLEVVKMERRIP